MARNPGQGTRELEMVTANGIGMLLLLLGLILIEALGFPVLRAVFAIPAVVTPSRSCSSAVASSCCSPTRRRS